ncbi:hypothetical protein MUK42_21979 [Musa troglodytarum]|uniref:Uncharacterized protein n=1 Tax=Musa troglodytarum TaxID=320322 RepID=A0A9E7K9I2_9LILI|nr:hypothetical protein MUK42_21979 [Musa troglodytarum]
MKCSTVLKQCCSDEDENDNDKHDDDDTGKDYWEEMHFMEKGIRGMARRQRSDFLRHVIEKVSLMSNSWGIPSSPVGSSQSKL